MFGGGIGDSSCAGRLVRVSGGEHFSIHGIAMRSKSLVHEPWIAIAYPSFRAVSRMGVNSWKYSPTGVVVICLLFMVLLFTCWLF